MHQACSRVVNVSSEIYFTRQLKFFPSLTRKMDSRPINESTKDALQAIAMEGFQFAFPEPPTRNPARSQAPMAMSITCETSNTSPRLSAFGPSRVVSLANTNNSSTSSLSLPDNPAEPFSLPDFELHYNVSDCSSVKDTLERIVQELSSENYIHNWDEKLVSDSVKDTAVYAKRELIRTGIGTASYMINFATVNDVYTTNGINSVRPGPQDPSRLGEHFFGSKVRHLDCPKRTPLLTLCNCRYPN
jgi:hypothetical protein